MRRHETDRETRRRGQRRCRRRAHPPRRGRALATAGTLAALLSLASGCQPADTDTGATTPATTPVPLEAPPGGGALPPGPTPDPGAQACGGLQGLACGPGEYCRYEPSARCGAADQMGVCAPRPEACTMQHDPVCGCDDRTHANACVAAREGTSVVSPGPCE